MHRKAFTLIELLVVISIISLLSSVVLASLNAARSKARIGAGVHFAAQVDHIAGEQGIGLWDFDECAGTAADRSGFGYTATANGATGSPLTPTNRGCSMLFDGTNDYVDTTFPVTDLTTWTMSAWIYDTKANGAYRAIIQTTSQANGDYALYNYPTNYLGFYNCGGGGTPANSIPSNEWTHVAAVYDSTVGFKHYINGVLRATVPGSCAAANHWDFVHIGGIDTTDSERWRGMIDNVHIFAKTLTASEVGDLYAAEREAHEDLARSR